MTAALLTGIAIGVAATLACVYGDVVVLWVGHQILQRLTHDNGPAALQDGASPVDGGCDGQH